MEKLPKYHIDIKAGDQMFHFRTDDVEEVAKFTGLQVFNAEILLDYMKKLNSRVNHVEEKIIKEASENSLDMGCKHLNAKTISGQGDRGRWEGLACPDCGQVNFKNHTKDGGTFWTGWKAKKAK